MNRGATTAGLAVVGGVDVGGVDVVVVDGGGFSGMLWGNEKKLSGS